MVGFGLAGFGSGTRLGDGGHGRGCRECLV
jgi:hypothetical protein